MSVGYNPKNEQTLNQSLTVQGLDVSGQDLALYTLTTPSGPVGPSLGNAESFAVLGGSAVTNTGNSVITGDLGSSPTGTITGFPPGVVVGTIHSADAAAANAQTSLTSAYNDLVGRTGATDLTGQDLGGLTLTAGVYKFTSSAQLTGTLTLNGQGNPNALFIFQIGSTLTTASASSVVLTNGAVAANVYWQVGSSATLGTTTSFKGNILALTSITLTTGASIIGRALARNGAVTLDTNIVTKVPSAVAGNLIVHIREFVTKIFAVSCKVDGTNTFTEFPSASLVLLDSITGLAGGNQNDIQVTGLSALANGDCLSLRYSTKH